MDSKTLAIRAFNQHFLDFLNDIKRIYPDQPDIIRALTSLEAIKKANPALIPRIWHKYIYLPYQDQIEHGEIAFFLEKDYAEDLTRLANADKILRLIDKIRGPISQMDTVNQAHSVKYIQTLSKLSQLCGGAVVVPTPASPHDEL